MYRIPTTTERTTIRPTTTSTITRRPASTETPAERRTSVPEPLVNRAIDTWARRAMNANGFGGSIAS